MQFKFARNTSHIVGQGVDMATVANGDALFAIFFIFDFKLNLSAGFLLGHDQHLCLNSYVKRQPHHRNPTLLLACHD